MSEQPETQEEMPADSASILLDNIYYGHQAFFLSAMTDATKDHMIKDGLISCAMDFVKAMNAEFEDVSFKFKWVRLHQHQDYSHKQYDKQYIDEDDYLDVDYERYTYYELPLEELGLEIEYTWKRTCSMGHAHYQKRYHLYSSPQWLTMMSHWKLRPTTRDFMREYIHDFFYAI